jgi:cytochrome c551/c552
LPDTPLAGQTGPEKDPVVSQSLAVYLLIGALLLVVTLGWALYDEFYGLRPWKAYQTQFAARYHAFLERETGKQKTEQQRVEGSAEHAALMKQLEELQKETDPKVKEIDAHSAAVDARMNVVLNTLTDARGYVGSQIYIIEHTSSSASKKPLGDSLKKYEQGPFVLNLPAEEAGGAPKEEKFTFEALQEEFTRLTAKKGDLLLEKAALLRPVSELQRKADSYVKDHMNGLTVEALEGLQAKTKNFNVEIRQINNEDAGIVDRCQSCHLGILEPVTIAKTEMGKDELAGAFTSHPDMELLKIHDPQKFGCTPCHNGSGMELDSVEKAHGEHEHWLWPLYPKENVEAGCQQCHASDMVVDHAPTLSAGKDLFMWRGCIGCHRYQGYDTEPEELVVAERTIDQLAQQRAQNLLEVQKVIKAGDSAPDNETARKYYAQADDLRLGVSKIDLQSDQLRKNVRFLLMATKKVGPDLKEVRAKLRPDWIPVWLENPHAFRPSTRMPRFRLDEDELPAVAAFIWQDALDVKLPKQPAGDPVKGKESFETRGCMGCHSVGEGDKKVGGWFAANLSRVGEKDNYDFLVRWIHNPRERSAPYCPFEKRDLTAADYQKHGLPFVFDQEHARCPNDGHELQVEQMTVMPNLRLSWDEARNIASYLETLKEKDPSSYPASAYLNDPKLRAKGEAIVKRYGCMGCHEITGLENEGRIGTDLTKEGSKPLEQMDFALFVRQAEREGWHSHKGFFEHKLSAPEVYDVGMIKAEGEELKMPNFFEPAAPYDPLKAKRALPELAPEAKQQVEQLTTFLMGSVDSQYPERYWYLPPGQKRDVQEGWWIVKKYNCEGCHQFTLDQPSVLMTLPQYQTPDGKGLLPPRLVTEGARVNPEWLARFLANPALSDTDTDRDGVRSYLKLRMPTFYLSPIEVRKLVRFFQAISQQPMPYIPPKLEPLSNQETAMARALFTSRAAPCLKCHAIGLPSHDRYATAPNFLLAQERLKPDWVTHWILDPSMIDPGTAMPSGLFKQEGGRWVFNGPTPPIFQGYSGDQVNLLMRYLFELSPAEQQRLIQMSGGSLNPAAGNSSSTRLRHEFDPAPPTPLVGMLAKAH